MAILPTNNQILLGQDSLLSHIASLIMKEDVDTLLENRAKHREEVAEF